MLEHPELFHYTNASGLEGILQNQTLRATHYAHLNDAEEIRHFLKNRLPEVFEGVLLNHCDEEEARLLGKSAAESLQERLLNSVSGIEPLAEPFITSFCTPSDSDDGRVKEHGLLSQWRGYGKDGGYALVFDTKRLSQLLTEFAEMHENCGHLFVGDVVYSSDSNEIFTEEFADDLTTMEVFLSNLIREDEDNKSLKKIYGAVMRCACRYKHWGFKEENEVRLIYIPNSREVCEFAKAEEITIKEIAKKSYVRAGTNVPYVDLLEGITSSTRSLPIQRVIVGPCAKYEKARRVRAVEILLNQHHIEAEVTPSEIPFVG